MATNSTITTNSNTTLAAALEAAGLAVAPVQSLREELASAVAEVRQQNKTIAAANRVVAEVKTNSKENVLEQAKQLEAASAAKSQAYLDVMSASDAAKVAREELAPSLIEARRLGNTEGVAKLQKLMATPAAELVAAQQQLAKANEAERSALLALCAAQRTCGQTAPDPEKWVEDAIALVAEAEAVCGWDDLRILDIKLQAIRFAPAKAGGEARREAKTAYFEAKGRLVAAKEAARAAWEARRCVNGSPVKPVAQLSPAEQAAKAEKAKADRARHEANRAARGMESRALKGSNGGKKQGR